VSNGGSGFTSAGSSVSVSVGTTVPTDESDTGDSSSETGGTTGEATSSTGGDDSGTGGTTAATLDPTGGSSGGVDPTDGQPADGMYSPCLQAAECAPLSLCIQSVDADMNPIDGFCSATGCSNPAMDCDPAPGGTATPVCVPITVNAMAQMACALNCQGLVCPTGMMCLNFTDLGMICM